ncbi:MAG: pyridoxal phosphate-dependent aminotransferase [Candidatus Thorarchaeota archaeon]
MDLGYSDRYMQFKDRAREMQGVIDISLCDPPRFGFRPDAQYFDTTSPIEGGYPSVKEELLNGIAERTKSFTGVPIDPEDILITNGVGGALATLAISLKDQPVGIHCPLYLPIYEFFRRTSDMWYLRCPEELDWQLDIDSVRKELESRNRPGYMIIVTPSNPTGMNLEEKGLKALVNLAGEYNQVIVTDEVYDEMSFSTFSSALTVAKDVPMIYLHGFSKVWRAPEIRLGYMIFHDPAEKITPLCDEIRSVCNLGFGVNPHSQEIGVRLLTEPSKVRKELFNEMKRRRDALLAAIEESENLSTVPAQGATYQLIKTTGNDWELSERLLKEERLLVTPGSIFDPWIGDNCLRVVFLNSSEHLVNFVEKVDILCSHR